MESIKTRPKTDNPQNGKRIVANLVSDKGLA